MPDDNGNVLTDITPGSIKRIHLGDSISSLFI